MPSVDKTEGRTAIVPRQQARSCRKRRRTDDAVPARYRNRPSRVRVAIYSVWDHSASLGFTKSTTAVLQAILAAGVSAENPYEPVFAKKATLAKLARCSEVTVYRAMRFLEESGWITRSSQERLEDGSMDIGLVSITEKLATLVGFIVSPTNQQCDTTDKGVVEPEANKTVIDTEAVAHGFQSNPRAEAVSSGRQDQNRLHRGTASGSSSGKMKDGLIGGPIYTGERLVDPKASVNHQSTRQEFVRIEGRSVARELVWLIEEGRLTFGALFQLQTLAKQVPGQQLSDFVAFRSERIKQLSTANDCYRYLKKLITDGIDARYLCKVRAKQEHRVMRRQQRDDAASKRTAWCRARHEMTFINPVTKLTFKINANHGLLEVGENGMPSKRPNLKISSKFLRAVEEGRLVQFVRQEAPIDRDQGQRHLVDLTAKFPWLRRKGKDAAGV